MELKAGRREINLGGEGGKKIAEGALVGEGKRGKDTAKKGEAQTGGRSFCRRTKGKKGARGV